MYFLFLFATVTMVAAIIFSVSIMCRSVGLQKQEITDMSVFLSTVILFSGAFSTAVSVFVTDLSWQAFPTIYSSVVLGTSVAVVVIALVFNRYKVNSLKSFIDF